MVVITISRDSAHNIDNSDSDSNTSRNTNRKDEYGTDNELARPL